MARSPLSNLQGWAKIMAATITVLLLIVFEHVEALRLDKQLKIMRKEADRLTYENASMQRQIHQWVSPSHLETVARRDLHMGPVEPTRVVGVER